MKKEVNSEFASRLINCGGIILVTAGVEGQKTITPCAWHMPLSKSPNLVAVALAQKHFSSQLIKESKEFAINVPDWSLLDKVMVCGSVSGRKLDKFKEAGLTPQKANCLVHTPIVAECKGAIECTLYRIHEVGDHYLFVGNVVCVQVQEDCFVNGIWDTKKVELAFHLGSRFFFKSSAYSEIKK